MVFRCFKNELLQCSRLILSLDPSCFLQFFSTENTVLLFQSRIEQCGNREAGASTVVFLTKGHVKLNNMTNDI